MAVRAWRGAVRFIVPARTESLAIARQVVAGIADSLELEELDASDLKLIVSEACGNAIRHAYGPLSGEQPGGPVEIEIKGAEDCLEIAVRDQGTGFVPAVAHTDTLGLGIPLMASVARVLELRAREGGGVELRAELAIGAGARPEPYETPGTLSKPGLDDEAARIRVGGEPMLRPVLARMIGICAARLGLTVDELADSLILSDALSAGIAWGERTEVILTETPEHAVLTIGPVPAGGGQALIDGLEIPGMGTLTKLAKEVSFQIRENGDDSDAGEYLTVTVAARARA